MSLPAIAAALVAASSGTPVPPPTPAPVSPPGSVPGAPTSLPIDAGAGSSVLPGSNFLHQLANGIGSWALIAAAIGIFVGAVMWAFGSYSQNYQQAYNGRKGVVVSGLAALLIGAGPYLIGFFFAQGRNIT